jgi:hypothetical protein
MTRHVPALSSTNDAEAIAEARRIRTRQRLQPDRPLDSLDRHRLRAGEAAERRLETQRREREHERLTGLLQERRRAAEPSLLPCPEQTTQAEAPLGVDTFLRILRNDIRPCIDRGDEEAHVRIDQQAAEIAALRRQIEERELEDVRAQVEATRALQGALTSTTLAAAESLRTVQDVAAKQERARERGFKAMRKEHERAMSAAAKPFQFADPPADASEAGEPAAPSRKVG